MATLYQCDNCKVNFATPLSVFTVMVNGTVDMRRDVCKDCIILVMSRVGLMFDKEAKKNERRTKR